VSIKSAYILNKPDRRVNNGGKRKGAGRKANGVQLKHKWFSLPVKEPHRTQLIRKIHDLIEECKAKIALPDNVERVESADPSENSD